MTRSGTSLWILPSGKRTFISGEGRRFVTYVTDELQTVNDCYRGKVLRDGHIDMIGEQTEKYKTYGYVK